MRAGASSAPVAADDDDNAAAAAGDDDDDDDDDAAVTAAGAAAAPTAGEAEGEDDFDPAATIGLHVLLANAEAAASAAEATAEAEAAGAWAAVGMLSGICGNVRTADQGGLLPCETHPRVLRHLAGSDDEEAAEAFGVVKTRTFGTTKAALGFATKLKRRANVGSAAAPVPPTAATATTAGARHARHTAAGATPRPLQPVQRAIRAPAEATVAVAGFESAAIAATQLQLSPVEPLLLVPSKVAIFHQ